jgi:cellulose synthase/poly-beta-1,6-N-acetylglucosamine synthase-like glycosyltransferase
VLALFGDPAVGGVQLPVRIRNRHGLLALMQDVEFWGVSALAQFGRVGSGTVSLGGNGQFTRLRAVRSLDRDPWQVSLTEDLDLTLALAAKGWRLTTTPQAYVSQQGLTRLRPLVNQRTRWFQGHLAAARWLPELWSSRRLSHLGMLELSIYIMVPWMLVLPWSVLFNYGMFAFVGGLAMGGNVNGMGQGAGQQAVTLALWYVMSFGPNWMAGYLYSRQQREASLPKALLLGHLLILANYVTYISCWRALYRMLSGQGAWDKTKREVERGPDLGMAIVIDAAGGRSQ